ncbi:MAG: hypothetical protein V4721_13965 [Bacteroidota bacterium]
MANFKIVITEKGSKRAYPAIWYAGLHGHEFLVTVSERWKSMYEVVAGEYAGKIIDPKDCKKL